MTDKSPESDQSPGQTDDGSDGEGDHGGVKAVHGSLHRVQDVHEQEGSLEKDRGDGIGEDKSPRSSFGWCLDSFGQGGTGEDGGLPALCQACAVESAETCAFVICLHMLGCRWRFVEAEPCGSVL